MRDEYKILEFFKDIESDTLYELRDYGQRSPERYRIAKNGEIIKKNSTAMGSFFYFRNMLAENHPKITGIRR